MKTLIDLLILFGAVGAVTTVAIVIAIVEDNKYAEYEYRERSKK